MSALSARNAYRLWAPTYATETATSFLEDELSRAMLRGLPCSRLLDAGCGVGRRIADLPGAVGVDASPEMVAAAGTGNVTVADVRDLPFGPDRFDMVWCRLVLGHLPDALPAYRELCRVCSPGGHVFVTDFHPDAVAAGSRRAFRDQAGMVHEVEHHVHQDHMRLAAQAGLLVAAHRDAAVGASIRDFYVRAGRMGLYKRDRGLKLVAGFLFRRPA